MRTLWMVLGGAAVGAGVGYLLSPACSETRRVLRERAVELAHEAEERVSATSQVLAEKAQEGKQRADELLAQGQEIAQQARETYHKLEEVVTPVREIAQQGREVLGKARAAYEAEPAAEPQQAAA